MENQTFMSFNLLESLSIGIGIMVVQLKSMKYCTFSEVFQRTTLESLLG